MPCFILLMMSDLRFNHSNPPVNETRSLTANVTDGLINK